MLEQLPWALSSFFIQSRACSALPSTTLNAIPRYNPILRPFHGKFSNCRQIMLNSIHHSTRCTTFFCRWQIKWMGLCGCMGLTHWTHFLLPIFTDLCFLPLVGQRARSQRKVQELDEKIFGAVLTKSMNTYYLWHSEKARKMTAKRTNEIHGKKEAPHWFAWVGNVRPDVFILV